MPPISSGNESAFGVTSRFAPRLRNSRAKRSPTSSETLIAAVATAIPNARAAPVRSLCRGRRLKESATSLRNMGFLILEETVLQPTTAVRIANHFLQPAQAQTGVSVLLGHLFFRLRQRTHIHNQVAALNTRRYTNGIAAARFANGRHINRRAAVPADYVLAVLAVAFRTAYPACIQRRAVAIRLLDDHEAQRLTVDSHGEQMHVRVLNLAQRYAHFIAHRANRPRSRRRRICPRIDKVRGEHQYDCQAPDGA